MSYFGLNPHRDSVVLFLFVSERKRGTIIFGVFLVVVFFFFFFFFFFLVVFFFQIKTALLGFFLALTITGIFFNYSTNRVHIVGTFE
jgi:hypothetical protein